MNLLATPFDPITGDLLPDQRELYLRGQLPPATQQTVEDYLKRSPVQANLALGRYHQLAAAAQRRGQTFVPPQWVQKQLLYQPSVSAVGPLRRPAVRGALAVLVVLCGASGVQWLRNEPLVPAPVVEAVANVSRATQTLARQSMATLYLADEVAAEPAPAAAPPVAAPVQPVAWRRPEPVSRAQTRPVAVQLADSTAAPATEDAVAPAELVADAMPYKVRGRIFNENGQPLAGATVLVVGSTDGTSTNANGEYLLEAPADALLQFGYAGCTDKVLPCRPNQPLDVTLEELPRQRRRVSL